MRISRSLLALALALVFAVASAVEARRARRPASVHEPLENRHGTVLVSRSGKASVISAGHRARIALRRNERLTEVAEAGPGWVAAGLREAGGGTGLVVVRRPDSARGAVERLPAPARGGGLHRAAPRILVGRERLAGVAWLEGARPDRLAVRAAEWSGAGWTDSTVVAPAAAGSQTGLAQAVLPDGSWLLVWSRHDGRENDLYWSLRSGGNWTPPAPLERADGAPDVTPTLVATADGALLAWSEYDGRDYRLRAARFTAGQWRRLPLEAAPGALYPKFRRNSAGTWVLFRTAFPGGWAAVKVEANGVPSRLARVATPALERPLLVPGSSGMSFEWRGNGGRRIAASWEAPE